MLAAWLLGPLPAALRRGLGAITLGAALAACAQPPPADSPRLLLTAAPGAPSGEALRAAVAARAGVAVVLWAPVDARTAGLRLACSGAVCDEAIARLRADTALVAALVADEVQRVPPPPARDAAR
jgi:hypothetical protein